MENKFFRLLREKLSIKPDRNMDQGFWQRFEAEFGKATRPKSNLMEWLRVPWWAVATLVLIFIGSFQWSAFKNPPLREYVDSTIIVINQPILTDLDLFLEIDVDKMSENDWEILLDEAES